MGSLQKHTIIDIKSYSQAFLRFITINEDKRALLQINILISTDIDSPNSSPVLILVIKGNIVDARLGLLDFGGGGVGGGLEGGARVNLEHVPVLNRRVQVGHEEGEQYGQHAPHEWVPHVADAEQGELGSHQLARNVGGAISHWTHALFHRQRQLHRNDCLELGHDSHKDHANQGDEGAVESSR